MDSKGRCRRYGAVLNARPAEDEHGNTVKIPAGTFHAFRRVFMYGDMFVPVQQDPVFDAKSGHGAPAGKQAVLS